MLFEGHAFTLYFYDLATDEIFLREIDWDILIDGSRSVKYYLKFQTFSLMEM